MEFLFVRWFGLDSDEVGGVEDQKTPSNRLC
jgi:hypothetical protein